MDPLPAIRFDAKTVFIILALILLSGVFSLFYSALNACRKPRLEKERGKPRKQLLKALSNTQYWALACGFAINVLRLLAAVIAGICIMRYLEAAQTSALASVLFIAAVILLLGISAVLLGDSLPGLISIKAPEKIAALLLPFIKALSLPLAPFILFASLIDSFFHSAFHLETGSNSITEDELRLALMEGEKSGIVESNERTMVEGVFYLGDRPVGAFMTHRSEVIWLDCNAPYEKIRAKAVKYRLQRCFPVVNGGPDEIIGAVYLEDIILDTAQPSPQGLRAIMKNAQFVPETMSALKAFESFKQGQANFLFVMDEYGGLAGIISITALVEEIVGELSTPLHKEESLIRQEDGNWLADGALNIDDAAKTLSLTGLGEDGDYHTLAGFVLNLSGELPKVGDCYDYQGYRFTVKEMNGNRIDKLLISSAEIHA